MDTAIRGVIHSTTAAVPGRDSSIRQQTEKMVRLNIQAPNYLLNLTDVFLLGPNRFIFHPNYREHQELCLTVGAKWSDISFCLNINHQTWLIKSLNTTPLSRVASPRIPTGPSTAVLHNAVVSTVCVRARLSSLFLTEADCSHVSLNKLSQTGSQTGKA